MIVNWVALILELKVLSFESTIASDTVLLPDNVTAVDPVTTTDLFKYVFQIQAYSMVWTYFVTEIDVSQLTFLGEAL
jgi:hypothetical protein